MERSWYPWEEQTCVSVFLKAISDAIEMKGGSQYERMSPISSEDGSDSLKSVLFFLQSLVGRQTEQNDSPRTNNININAIEEKTQGVPYGSITRSKGRPLRSSGWWMRRNGWCWRIGWFSRSKVSATGKRRYSPSAATGMRPQGSTALDTVVVA